jgi:FPC/CPF motif-containing protein YcgG
VDIDDGFASFIALFRGPHIDDERQFEELLWEQLREVHAADEQPWAPDVDLHVGLTACSAEKPNGGVCKPIDYELTPG